MGCSTCPLRGSDSITMITLPSLRLLPHTEVARLSFNGNQYMRITVSANSRSKVEDIFLRFRTRFPDGLLVATSSDNVIDMLMVEVKQGLIRVITNYGIGQTMITAGHGLDDNRWHAVHVQRRDDRLMVTVDNTDRAEGKDNYLFCSIKMFFIFISCFCWNFSTSKKIVFYIPSACQFELSFSLLTLFDSVAHLFLSPLLSKCITFFFNTIYFKEERTPFL